MKCYACDEVAVGLADDSSAVRVAACKRHSNPEMPSLTDCIYCERPTRHGTVDTGNYGPQRLAHAKCIREAEAY